MWRPAIALASGTILDKIVATTREALARRQREQPLAELARRAAAQPAPRDLAAALGRKGIAVIAEVKRASPSKGPLRPGLDAAALARDYVAGGAAAISVLTEEAHFRGSLADMETVRREVKLPLLLKDFIVEPYQIYEARAYGADAVLLIAAILDDAQMKALLQETRRLGMRALVEVHNQAELERALKVGPRIIGINNRNLADFSVSLETTLRLRPLLPPGVVMVSESGIHSRQDVLRLEQAGVNAILVGESLVTASDPVSKLKELVG